MVPLKISLDESVSVAGVEDLGNSWVIAGMTIALKGRTVHSRWRLAQRRRSVSENPRGKGRVTLYTAVVNLAPIPGSLSPRPCTADGLGTGT
jgi:hypothetical protein